MSTRPKVFVSSTVYDFRDLRSALKYWLEQHGYEVRLSDQADFPQKPELNSYESCLQAIDDSDYFILLVGGRVGGWYDEAARVSITRMEYRRAYERAKAGRLRLLAFVRKDVWDIREDRGQLKRFLAGEHGLDAELSDADIAAITAHPSKFVTDAEAVFDFLKEVGRVPEMKAAAAKQGDLPPGNWIHQFVTFRDIADAVKVGMRITGTLQRATLAANLYHEVVQNLRQVTDKSTSGKVHPSYRWGTPAREKTTPSVSGMSCMSGDDLKRLGFLLLMEGGIGSKLGTLALHEAITSGAFLDFDRAGSQYVAGLAQQSFLRLADLIRRLALGSEKMNELARELIAKYRDSGANVTHEVRNSDIMAGVVLHDYLRDFTHTSVAVLRYLTDQNEQHLVGVTGPLHGPFQEFSGGEQESPSTEEVVAWASGFRG